MTTVSAPVAELQAQPPFEVTLGNEQIEFSGTNRLFAEVAEGFGVEVGPQERKDWQTLGRAAYVIDQYLDVVGGNVMPDIAPRLFSGRPIAGVPETLSEDCRSFLERQSPSRQTEIREMLDRVKPLVDRQAAAVSPDEVVAIREEEAELLANFLSLPAENRPDAVGRQKFNAWLVTFCRTGYMLDSFLDIKEDFESGASGVPPSFSARRVLAAATLRETIAAARQMPIRTLGKCAIVAVRYELKNQKPDFSRPNQAI